MPEYYAKMFNIAKYLTPPMRIKKILNLLKRHIDSIVQHAMFVQK